jgi:tetratricopeptide (TPR) repeat protein
MYINPQEENMKNILMKTMINIAVCLAMSVYGKSQSANSGNGLRATVAKVTAGLVQTAQEQFKSGRDSAAAETCLRLYDLDNEANLVWLMQAGEWFARAGMNVRSKAAFDRYLDKHSDRQVMAKLAAVEFALRNYARVVDLAKQIPGLVASQESLTMIVAESQYAIGAFDEVVALLPAAKLVRNRHAIELVAASSEKMGDFKSALSLYEKLSSLSSDAQRKKISMTIAMLYENMGLKAKAAKEYERIIMEYPADLAGYECLARIYMTDCQWRQARTLLEKASAFSDATPKVMKMLAQCLAEEADRVAAVNQYRQYLARVPADSAAWCELGSVYFEQEHYADAIDALKKAVAIMPKNTECLMLLGECYMKNGDTRSAIAPFEQCRQIRKNNVVALTQLAKCYRGTSDDGKLLSVVKDWATFDPRNIAAQNELAEIYIRGQKWRDAIPVLESALGLDGTNVRANLLYAKACEKTANENGRFGHLRTAYQYGPDDANVLYELGAAYAGRNQYGAARPLLAKAVSIDPMNAQAHFEFGRVLENSGDKNGAFEHLSTAAQLDPFNTAYLAEFAKVAYSAGKTDVAFDYIKTALSRDSTQFELLQWAGIMYKEAGSVDIAKRLLLKAVVRSATCASCCKYLADIYFDNGDYGLAIKFYNQSLSIGSYSEAASMGLGNALFLSGDVKRALTMYEKIFSGNTRSEEALYRVCSAYIRMGVLDKAKSLFAQYAGDRKGGWTHLTRGEIAEAEGRTEDALKSFTVASTLAPGNPLAHADAGRIDLMKKEYEKAVENFGRALGFAPHNVDFLLGMGKSYEGIGQLSAAFELYAGVARMAPKQPDVFGLMGQVLSLEQQHDQAIVTYRRGLELYPKNPALAYGLGHELSAMMQFNDAIEAFKKSVRTRSDEKRFFEAYKDIGDIYYYDLKNPEKAKDFYKKYMKFGGKDETVVSMVNSAKK